MCGSQMFVELAPSMRVLLLLPEADFELAKRWRAHSRDIFEAMFDSGFVVTDFVPHEDEHGAAHRCLFRQDVPSRWS